MYKKFLLTFILGILIIPNLIFAHGTAENPKSRQLMCYEDGNFWDNDGNNIPNPACKEAFKKSNNYQFVQWNEFSALVQNYNDLKAVKKVITDGNLCSAGDSKKAGMDMPSKDWQKTELASGSTFRYILKATATHDPSFFEIYITKKGVNTETSALKWEDLELIHTEKNLPPSGGKYIFNVKLPDRTGNAIIYTRWQRIDSAGEGFYGCSDVKLVDKK